MRTIGKRVGVVALMLLVLMWGLSAQDAPRFPLDTTYFLEVEVNNPTPYVGQQIVYTVRFYTATLPEYIQILPDFRNFWLGDEIFTRYAEIINGRQYTVSMSEYLLYPLSAGALTITPTRITIPETLFTEGVRLSSDALMLEARPLPDDRLPEGFGGAVGRFEVSSTLDRRTVTLGDPLLLSLRVSGTGNIATLTRPVLTVPQGWRAYPRTTSTDVSVQSNRLFGVRVFEWRLIADRAGTVEVGGFDFSYFDPDRELYVTLNTSPHTVDVLPGAGGALESVRVDRALFDNQRLPLLAVPPQSRGQMGGAEQVIGWIIPPLVCAGLWWGLRARRMAQTRAREQRRQAALKTALATLKQLRDRDDIRTAQAFVLIDTLVLMYASDKLGQAVTRADLLGQDLSIPAEVVSALIDCLNLAENGRYTPSPLAARQVIPVLEQTAQILKATDARW